MAAVEAVSPPKPGTGENHWTVYFDGGSRGNPGISGAGAVLYVNGEEHLAVAHAMVDGTTNNQAEYLGAALAVFLIELRLRAAHSGDAQTSAFPTSLTVVGDSKLVVQQISGKWQVRAKRLMVCAAQVRALVRRVERKLEAAMCPGTPDPINPHAEPPRTLVPPKVQWTHVRRAHNKRADALSNNAMDAHSGTWDGNFETAPSPFSRSSALGEIAQGYLGTVKSGRWRAAGQL